MLFAEKSRPIRNSFEAQILIVLYYSKKMKTLYNLHKKTTFSGYLTQKSQG